MGFFSLNSGDAIMLGELLLFVFFVAVILHKKVKDNGCSRDNELCSLCAEQNLIQRCKCWGNNCYSILNTLLNVARAHGSQWPFDVIQSMATIDDLSGLLLLLLLQIFS